MRKVIGRCKIPGNNRTGGESVGQVFSEGLGGIGEAGQVLVIHNVTRYCGGQYECVAENGVPPSVRREINVRVQFEPEIMLPNKRIGQSLGKDTILECVVSAHPQAVTMWKFHGKHITSDEEKYSVNIYQQPATDIVTLSLYIRDLQPSDYGKYNCIASNPLGQTNKKMTLYEHVEAGGKVEIVPRDEPTSTRNDASPLSLLSSAVAARTV
ncbi:hypothetical protein BaRGS_00003598, partial [Batillaria attramentaria]